jgi:branched-subunit amino acid transport protein
MDGALKLWAVVAAVGALNYLSRLSFIALLARRSPPALLARALKFVPAAMLTALILPMIVDWKGTAADFATAKVAASLVAAAIAFSTRSLPKTLGVGMAALWLLQWAQA